MTPSPSAGGAASQPRRPPAWWWGATLAVVAAALAARYAVMFHSTGSNDIYFWDRFGREVLSVGVLETYRTDAYFNHPPLMGLYAGAAMWLNNTAGLWFPVGFKSLAVAGDLLAAGTLAVWWRRQALDQGRAPDRAWRSALAAIALYLLNPVSFAITAYHGNTDSLLAALALLAALLAQSGRPFWAGLALAAALNVKLSALFLGPPLLFSQRNWRDARRFSLGLGLGLVPFVPVLALVGKQFYVQAVAYNSNPEKWGLQALLQEAANAPHLGRLALLAREAYAPVARYVIAATSVAVAVLGRRRPNGQEAAPVRLAALSFAAFLVLTPGFGVQYLVWPTALLFAVDRGAAIRWALAAGAMCWAHYLHFWNGSWTRAESFIAAPFPPHVVLLGLVAWLGLTHFVAGGVWQLARVPDASAPK